MTPAQWKKVWGLNRLVFVRKVNSPLPVLAKSFFSMYGFPRRMIFEGSENSFEISFELLSKELDRFNNTFSWGDFYDKKLDKAWSKQLVIADEEFCNGHASYCVHSSEETVTRIDVELAEPETFVNSTIPQFGDSLLVAMKWSSDSRQADSVNWKKSLEKLRTEISLVDPKIENASKSFWPRMIEHLGDLEAGSFEITNDPKRSKPRF